MSNRRLNRGVTLVEMLVSLTILALLSTTMLSALSVSRKILDRAVLAERRQGNSLRVHDFLQRLLEDTFPRPPSAGSERDPENTQKDTAVEVFSYSSGGVFGLGLSRYRLYVKRAPDALLDLYVHAEPYRSLAATSQIAPRDELLISHIEAIHWSYFLPARADKGRAAGWSDSWPADVSLPALFQLKIDFPPSEHKPSLHVYARPRVTNAQDCDFDVVTRTCRATT